MNGASGSAPGSAGDGASLLRRLREAAGISQRELARSIGEPHTAISFWERKGKLPRGEAIAPIARRLGVSIEEVLGLPPPSPKARPAQAKLARLCAEAAELPRPRRKRVEQMLEDTIRGQRALAREHAESIAARKTATAPKEQEAPAAA